MWVQMKSNYQTWPVSFSKWISKIHGKKSAPSFSLKNRLRFNSNFLEFFKCNTNSKSVICRKRNFLTLTLILSKVFREKFLAIQHSKHKNCESFFHVNQPEKFIFQKSFTSTKLLISLTTDTVSIVRFIIFLQQKSFLRYNGL